MIHDNVYIYVYIVNTQWKQIYNMYYIAYTIQYIVYRIQYLK